jgi:hypothetical protein
VRSGRSGQRACVWKFGTHGWNPQQLLACCTYTISPSPFPFSIFSSRSSRNVEREHQRTGLCCVASSGEVATGQRTFKGRGGELRRSRLLSVKVIPLHRGSSSQVPENCSQAVRRAPWVLARATPNWHG